MLQVLLLIAFLVELLAWIDHTEWGVLILAYGLWAQHTFSPRHLVNFTILLCLSVCMDSLTLAAARLSLIMAILKVAVLSCKFAAFVALANQL